MKFFLKKNVDIKKQVNIVAIYPFRSVSAHNFLIKELSYINYFNPLCNRHMATAVLQGKNVELYAFTAVVDWEFVFSFVFKS